MKGTRGRKIRFGIGILCGLCLVSAGCLFGINAYVKQKGGAHILTEAEAVTAVQEGTLEPDCILILGAGVWDGVPSPMLHDRLEEGLALYQAGVAERVLVSGDHGRSEYDEVNVMKAYLMAAGVPGEDIFMDHAGFSTYESMYRAREVFGVSSMVVVTQQYHLYRALYVAEQLGMTAYGVGSDPRQYGGQQVRECREILARAKDIFYVLGHKRPAYLGEEIDIHGDGSVTDDRLE